MVALCVLNSFSISFMTFFTLQSRSLEKIPLPGALLASLSVAVEFVKGISVGKVLFAGGGSCTLLGGRRVLGGSGGASLKIASVLWDLFDKLFQGKCSGLSSEI